MGNFLDCLLDFSYVLGAEVNTKVLFGSGPLIYNSFSVFKFHGILNVRVTFGNSFSVTFPDTTCAADEH